MKIIAVRAGSLKYRITRMESVRIKICGVTKVADAQAAAELGADFVGLNFYPPSPRYVAEEQAEAILDALPAALEPVAVLVKPTREMLTRPAGALARIPIVQWHDDRQEVRAWMQQRLIAVFPLKEPADLQQIREFLAECKGQNALPAAILIDAHVAGLYGGTGKTAPWELLSGVDLGVPIILAGGLTPDNVASAIRQVRPYAVDVASGVESAPGCKDLDKMKRFINNARNALG